MKDSEIRKGLECCQTYPECSSCPYNTGSADDDECKNECMTNALELIDRQREEIDMLRKERERLQHICISFMDEAETLERKYGADISNIPQIAVLGIERDNIVKRTRNEAIREFWDKLRKSISKSVDNAWHGDGNGIYDAENVLEVGDNLAKEMAGEENV